MTEMRRQEAVAMAEALDGLEQPIQEPDQETPAEDHIVRSVN